MLDPDIFTEMDCVRRQRRRGFLTFMVLTLFFTASGFFATYFWAQRHGLAELTRQGGSQLDGAISRLEREIDKHGTLPLTIAMDHDVIAFMQSRDRRSRINAMDRYLSRLNDVARTRQVFLIDLAGKVIASSNWGDETSYVGRSISYRPYFQRARPDVVNGYYAIGTTDKIAGYYLATAVEVDGKRVGVAAIKLDLGQLEKDWFTGVDQLMLMTDANRIVVLSSNDGWRYHSLGPLPPQKIEELNETQQYNRHVMGALSWTPSQATGDGGMIVTAGLGNETRAYLAYARFVPVVGMKLTVLSDYSAVKARAAERATIAAILILVAMLILRIINQRHLAVQERLMTREALQDAYNNLIQQFDERNQQLRATNEELRHEVAERIQAARQLQNFQDELIRTENLAVIGQLSAGLVHEINQPLAALSTLSENAVRFLELNDTGTVRHNLERICGLVRRMGILTGQLRSFARRTDGETGPVDLELCVESAVALLGHRISKGHIRIDINKPARPVGAHGDAVRLEQVLVNLISNAMDAVHGNGEPRLWITLTTQGDSVIVEVADNGHGLSGAVAEKLFEPFFTTKKTSGLGLGLAISQDIVRRFGGDLTARNGEGGGAVFRMVLRAAPLMENANA
jgi:two-component system C4-dicarboxylate transport sensor histidine kinase DctB